MAETPTTSIQAEPEVPTEQREEPRRISALWHRLALGGILLISVFMNFYKLGQNGFGTYYPAAIRSMMDNWHNFFFAAYDPGGFTSLDKPPAGFWLQVLSAKIFGLTPFSVLLPQAIAGVLAVLLLYHLVQRQFGKVAGLLAALILALTPISIVTNRNVTIDSTLALTMLVGAWAVLKAAETGRLRWLLLSAAMIGLGFNIKMMEAYLVIPAFGLLYLIAAPKSIWKRIGHLALALLVLLTISFSWIAAVELTPASQRPYVGSTQDNSVLSLALGYNGILRLLGLGPAQNTGPTPINVNNPGSVNNPGGTTNSPTGNAPTGNSNNGPTTTGNKPVRIGGPQGGGSFGPGPLRLILDELGGQIGWLLPLGIFGMIALIRFQRPHPQSGRKLRTLLHWSGWLLTLGIFFGGHPQDDRKLHALLLWGVWLVTMSIFFSVAGFIHEYYLTVMAPALAALCGIGLVLMWQDARTSGWRGWVLPVALMATVGVQVFILLKYPDWSWWLVPLILGLSVLAIGVLLGTRYALIFRHKERAVRFNMPALAIGLLALILVPTLWAGIPIFRAKETDIPLAGPGGRGGPALMTSSGSADPLLVRYLLEHQGSAQVLVATDGMADALILATNKSVLPLQGFSHYPLSIKELQSMLAKGTLRFLLVADAAATGQQGNIGGSVDNNSNDIAGWVGQHCQAVPDNLWKSSTAKSGDNNVMAGPAVRLYDCAGAH
jgi:4-amino-4-deoxy-L-arabinose transferase-like glycosyltransferase